MFSKMCKLILLFLFHLRFIHAQFEAKICGHLPEGHTFGAGVYDGRDKIYFLGGETSNATQLDTVVTYNTNTNETKIIGKFPARISSGASEIDETGNIFYFGGYTTSRVAIATIYRTSEHHPTLVVAHYLNKPTNRFSAVTIGKSSILIIGGRLDYSKSTEIIEYNTATNTLRVVKQLPVALESVSPTFDGKFVYIFGGKRSDGSTNSNIYKYDPTSGALQTLEQTTRDREINSVRYTGGNQSIILSNDTSGEVYFTRFHHNTETLEDLKVCFDHGRLHGPVSAYVPKLKTLYFHGVNPGKGEFSSEVFCVNFSKNYEVTCPPEGLAFLPHPKDCAKYFICNDGEPFPEECAEGLLFDTTLDKCNIADEVHCPRPLNCPADGIAYLPKIGDCSKYYLCIFGEEDEQECAEGSEFSPDEDKCVLEAEYNCPYE